MKIICSAVLMLAGVAAALGQTPRSKHVVLVVEENHSFDAAITHGEMPYLKSLAETYTLLTNYYANHHPSIGNYFTMTTGQTISTSDGYGGTVKAENIVSQMIAGGKSWKAYGDSLPQKGYIGGSSGPYAKKHFPLAYFDVVRGDDTQRRNLVPFEQFAADLNSPEGLPDFSMVVPNLDHDAHDGTLQQADAWLQKNIKPLLGSAGFLQDGVLIVTFDESFKSDKNHVGGHVATVVAGPLAKEHGTDDTFYQHESILATVEELLGLPRLDLVKNVPAFGNAFK